jgi:hypothetical protein
MRFSAPAPVNRSRLFAPAVGQAVNAGEWAVRGGRLMSRVTQVLAHHLRAAHVCGEESLALGTWRARTKVTNTERPGGAGGHQHFCPPTEDAAETMRRPTEGTSSAVACEQDWQLAAPRLRESDRSSSAGYDGATRLPEQHDNFKT